MGTHSELTIMKKVKRLEFIYDANEKLITHEMNTISKVIRKEMNWTEVDLQWIIYRFGSFRV